MSTSFAVGSLIIPTSAGYQEECSTVATFGLVYDVLRAENWLKANGYQPITIHYLYRSGKASPNRCTPTNLDTPPSPSADARWSDGCDFTLTGTGPLVKLVKNTAASTPASDTTASTRKTVGQNDVWPQYSARTIDTTVTSLGFLGAPFAIQAGADATTFGKLLEGSITALDSNNNPISFTQFQPAVGTGCSIGASFGVRIFRTTVAFSAEDNLDFSATPPRVALLATTNTKGTGGAVDGILENYLIDAGLGFAGAQGCPPGGVNAANKTDCPNGGTPGQIFDKFDFGDFTNTQKAGGLINLLDGSGNPLYGAAWAPHWDNSSGSKTPISTNETDMITNINTFLANHPTGVANECHGIGAYEGENGGEQPMHEFLTCKNNGAGACAAGPDVAGLDINLPSAPSGTLKNCTDPDEVNGNSCAFYGYPGDPFIQVGDYTYTVPPGGIHEYLPSVAGNIIYRPTTRALLSGVKSLNTAKTTDPVTARAIITADFETYGFYNGDITKGQIHYVAGHDISGQPNGDLQVLETLLELGTGASAPPPTVTEVTRSSPIATTIGSAGAIVQGTIELTSPAPAVPTVLVDGDIGNFTFPYQKGHFYATAGTSITTSPTNFKTITHIFDVSQQLVSGNHGSCQGNLNKNHKIGTRCRAIFTNLSTGQWPIGGGGSGATATYSYMDASTDSLIATEIQAATVLSAPLGVPAVLSSSTVSKLVQAVVESGTLGGVDRSTAAVVSQSNLSTSVEGISGTSRPTMVYFGATDGMLHAACVTVDPTNLCDVPGRELWSFMPRTEVPLIRFNATAVQGSPHVVEAFGDFYGTGIPSFKTILTFTTGVGVIPGGGIASLISGQTPAVYAIDITDPYVPRVLWEYTTPNAALPRQYEMGQGLFVDMGNATLPSGLLHPVTYVEANNAGSGGPAAVVMALDTVTGQEMWTAPFGFPYASGAHGDVPPVPFSGVPGGAVTIDKHQNGSVSDLVFGDLYGNVWEVDPATGSNRYTPDPLFTASTVGHPIGDAPAIYSNGAHQFAAFVTGGYTDLTGGAPVESGTQFTFSVMLDSSVGQLNELSSSQTNGQNNIGFVSNLTAGQLGFAQLLVVNNQIFLTTDSTNVNANGYGVGGSTGQAEGFTINSAGGIGATVVLGAVPGGAGSLANIGTTLYGSTAGAQQQLTTAASSTPGNQVNFDSNSRVDRLLFLRTR